jgi:hypothetical protein
VVCTYQQILSPQSNTTTATTLLHFQIGYLPACLPALPSCSFLNLLDRIPAMTRPLCRPPATHNVACLLLGCSLASHLSADPEHPV